MHELFFPSMQLFNRLDLLTGQELLLYSRWRGKTCFNSVFSLGHNLMVLLTNVLQMRKRLFCLVKYKGDGMTLLSPAVSQKEEYSINNHQHFFLQVILFVRIIPPSSDWMKSSFFPNSNVVQLQAF